ncbi:LytR/AlgR family response regulator transcription factor [Belliella kenyensis]|uniref:LytR/AlgR family response regulator transcription factor n=1 Tax=Belliella kenyensis TaxID=1472724 RepID=A0ABV8EF57_9BACT|nr:LytTR family DNA-binding domain-containing protein [Belliella kenyensis]MCH7401790.1 LytTR family transcriptional regulator [Belliella kenyensis]MDN3604289.1 LytTR family DNA-binding domain-containing protein [Belliella kenyensis]
MKELFENHRSNGNGTKEREIESIKGNLDQNLLIKDAIFVRNKGSLVKVKFNDILWMKGDGNYTTLVTRESVYSLRNILKDFESVLPDGDFIRIHKSYIVRLDEIVAINPRELTVGKDTVPVGRTYYQNLINGINKLSSGGNE